MRSGQKKPLRVSSQTSQRRMSLFVEASLGQPKQLQDNAPDTYPCAAI
jgi:hypothetical protein